MERPECYGIKYYGPDDKSVGYNGKFDGTTGSGEILVTVIVQRIRYY